MGEEDKNNTTLSEADIKAMEADARKAAEVEAKKIADDTEKKVRAQIEQENKLKELEASNKKASEELEAFKKEQAEKTKAMEEQFAQKLKDLEDSRQSTKSTNNPFRSEPGQTGFNDELKTRYKTDPEFAKQLEDESRKMFLGVHQGLPSDFGQQ